MYNNKMAMIMKRIYIKPEMMVVELQTRNHLLVGSDVSVYNTRYREEGSGDDWEDL